MLAAVILRRITSKGKKVGHENLKKITFTYGVVKSSFLLRGIPVGSDIVIVVTEGEDSGICYRRWKNMEDRSFRKCWPKAKPKDGREVVACGCHLFLRPFLLARMYSFDLFFLLYQDKL
jgi:hypothetical protein